MESMRIDHCPVRPGPPVVVQACAGLPPGCGVRVHRWASGTWGPVHAGVMYLLQYQCQVLTEPVGSTERECSDTTDANTVDIDPVFEDLFLLTVGGVPMATATVTCNPAASFDGQHWYIGLICGCTRTGAGAMLLQHLQSEVAAAGVRGLALSAFSDANVDVYRSRGFRSQPDVPSNLEMVWDM